MTSPRLARLARDRGGIAIVEFAIISPVLILMVMGLSDLCYRAYIQSVLTGAMERAGRASTIQGAGSQTAIIDEQVMEEVHTVAYAAVKEQSDRTSFASFEAVSGEPFEDTAPPSTQANNAYDLGKECFTDTNGNKTWDSDPGADGQGGADAVTVYTMTVRYPRLFPMAGLLGWSPDQLISAKTVLKNQPYETQAAAVRICPPPPKKP